VSGVGYFDILKLAMPETIVALAALVVLFIDLGIMRPAEGKFRRMIAALVTGTSCLVAIFWMHQVQQETAPGFLSGLLVVDPACPSTSSPPSTSETSGPRRPL